MKYVVLLQSESPPGVRCYLMEDPEDKESADQFAEFLTKEVDPATVVPAHSATSELLGWWRTKSAEPKPW